MKGRWFCALLCLALLLPAAAPATSISESLLTATIAVETATVYDGSWSNASPVGSLPFGTEVSVLQMQGDWTQIFARARRVIGWVPPGSLQVDYANAIFPGIVISQSVSLREGPSTSARRLATLPNSAVMDLLDEQDGWYYVSFRDGNSIAPLQGWVSKEFVVRNPSFLTTVKSTYVYAVPSRSAKKVGQVAADQELTIIGEYGDFWIVNLRSASGFIYKRDLEAR